jgi:UDP-N-acetyl-D-mannosaminuronic acid dehydrogenase
MFLRVILLNVLEIKQKLLTLIEAKEARIAVLGLGCVGLPTAALFANLGFRVTGVDINPKIVDQINSCVLHTKECSLDKLVITAHHKGLLSATSASSEALSAADVLIVCVQTPVDNQGNANLSFLRGACEEIAKILKRDKFVVIQSTVPPKTIGTIIVPILEKGSGLRCGVDFWLTYCPERMAPGNGLNDLGANARLIGAYDSESGVLGSALFKLATNGKLLMTDIPSAEVSKLAENTFRFVNIAFANELALICKQIGVDANEVIELANTHPRVNIHQPGCGAGGPCLSKDTHLLLSSIKLSTSKVEVISAAIRLNSKMPRYIANLAVDALCKKGKTVSKSKIAIFGTAYKGDVDDSRDSPAEEIIRELKKRKATLVVFDPNCSESFGEKKASSATEASMEADCIIIATDHKEFFELNLSAIKKLMKENPIIVDAKRTISPAEAKLQGFEYVTTSCVKENVAP